MGLKDAIWNGGEPPPTCVPTAQGARESSLDYILVTSGLREGVAGVDHAVQGPTIEEEGGKLSDHATVTWRCGMEELLGKKEKGGRRKGREQKPNEWHDPIRLPPRRRGSSRRRCGRGRRSLGWCQVCRLRANTRWSNVRPRSET